MPKEYLNPPTLFNSLQYGFSQIVTSQGGKLVHLSGQVAWDERQQLVGPGDLERQTRQTFQNINSALQTAGGTLTDVVSLRIYIVAEQMENTAPVSAALRDFFPTNPPASTWIGVYALANPDFLIEIEAVAIVE